MRFAKIIFIIAIFLLTAAFLTQNPQLSTSSPLRLDLLVWSAQSVAIPVYFLIIFAFMAGLIIGLIYLTLDRFSSKAEIKARNKRIKELENRVAELETQPAPETANQGQTS